MQNQHLDLIEKQRVHIIKLEKEIEELKQKLVAAVCNMCTCDEECEAPNWVTVQEN